MTKLTLSMEKSVVRQAKQLAKVRKTSVSAMVSDFVRSAAVAENPSRKIGPITQRLTGIIKLPAGKDYKEILTDALMEKYGLKK